MNQGMPNMPGSMPPMGSDMGSMGGTTPPPAAPPPVQEGEDPHEKIMASLGRIEEKLAAIAAKVGA